MPTWVSIKEVAKKYGVSTFCAKVYGKRSHAKKLKTS